MRTTYKEVADRKSSAIDSRTASAIKETNSVQEDNAFMNKLKNYRFDLFTLSEIKRLWSIAQSGITIRTKLDKAIAKARIDGNDELYEQLKEFKRGAN